LTVVCIIKCQFNFKLEIDLPEYEREGDIEYPFEDTDDVGDENKIRGNWSSRGEYLISSLGFIFGIGNIWRLPYLCYTYGGSTLFIPYFVMVIFAGFPLFFTELALGQFASIGCISVWKVVPLFKGVGIAMFLVSSIISIYYNAIASWSVFYFMSSLQFVLPWAECGHEWNTLQCWASDRDSYLSCLNQNGTVSDNGSCIFADYNLLNSIDTEMNIIESAGNLTFPVRGFNFDVDVMSSSEFFQNKVLSVSDSLQNIGSIKWQLTICLLVTWVMIFLVLFKGFKSFGKIAYFTVLTPFIIFVFLFVRLLSLPGSFAGLKYFFTPKWSYLLDFKIWGEVGVHTFYTLSLCTGGLVTLGSYNRFHNNVLSDAWFLCLSDCIFSVLSCCGAFSAIGFLCYEMDIPLDRFKLKDGLHLVFEILPEAIAKLPVAPLYALFYFGMVYFVILNTTTVFVETVVSALCDEFPERLRRNHRHVVTFTCSVLFCLGIPFCTQAGKYWLLLFDYFTPTWSLVILAFFEIMAVSWIYGVDNFLDNIKWMIRFYPAPYIFWKVLWKLICPFLYLSILAFAWFAYLPLEQNNYQFPKWTNFVGWCISLLPILMVPLTALLKFCFTHGTLPQRWRDLLCPEDDWGPALAIHRAEYYPFQVPEARRLIAPTIPEGKVVESTHLNGRNGTTNTKESKSSSSQVYTIRSRTTPFLPSFDRETAI
uniref:Transporter n=1 Tax=Syphacia muris TaxID=451379 RepID=A0A0N5AJ66_9BILA